MQGYALFLLLGGSVLSEDEAKARGRGSNPGHTCLWKLLLIESSLWQGSGCLAAFGHLMCGLQRGA
jgi:hypothetical protein